MKKLAYLLLICSVSPVLLKNSQDFLFNRFQSAWAEYGNFPTTENAKKLIDILPSYVANHHPLLFNENNLESETFRKLEINAFSGERTAVRVLFRMLNVSDGAVGEFLSSELGLLLRVNPRIFLEELKANRMFVPLLGPLLGNYGPFMGSNDAMEHERIRRIRAVESVVDKELAAVKAECLKELERMKYPPAD